MLRWCFATLIGPVVLLIVALFAACGGSGSPSQAFDPKNANSIAHAALIGPGDIAGAWSAAASDRFTDSSNASAIAGTAACKAADAAFKAATNSRSVGRAGRAEVLLAGGGSTTPTAAASPSPGTTPAAAAETITPTIEETVEVYQDTSVPSVALPLVRQAMASDDVQQCRADTVKAQFLKNFPDVTVSAKPFAPSEQAVAATADGFATAFTLTITSGQGVLELNFQTYGWRSGNALVTLGFFGTPDDVTSALVTATVEKAEAKLAATR